jgi:hypothetical protein
MHRRAPLLLGSLWVSAAFGCAGKPVGGVSAVTSAGAAEGRVAGRVVERWLGRPLAGRTVVIGGASVVTDERGAFFVSGVPASYDATVIDPNHAAISVFRGLHRRDPLLVHRSSETSDEKQVAEVRTTLHGGAPTNDDFVEVVFEAPHVTGGIVATPWNSSFARYPDVNPFTVVWTGADTITGDLFGVQLAHAAGGDPKAPTRAAFFGRQAITLRGRRISGAPTFEDLCAGRVAPSAVPAPPKPITLALAPIATRHIALLNEPARVREINIVYRLPEYGGEIALPAVRTNRRTPQPPFELEVPDPAALGATLCVRAGDGRSYGERCGPFSTPVPIPDVRPPPQLSLPNATFERYPLLTRETSVAWTKRDAGVYVLELETRHPSAAEPNVHIYTVEGEAAWPAPGPAHVPFPVNVARYDVEVIELAPFASLDAALGPGGLRAPVESYQSISDRAEMAASPTAQLPAEACGAIARLNCSPPAPPAARNEQWSPCDELARRRPLRIEPDDVNRKLRLHPDLAAAFGKSCARNCADVSAFEATYRAFAKQHPGFDANEPPPPLRLPPLPPPPGAAL